MTCRQPRNNLLEFGCDRDRNPPLLANDKERKKKKVRSKTYLRELEAPVVRISNDEALDSVLERFLGFPFLQDLLARPMRKVVPARNVLPRDRAVRSIPRLAFFNAVLLDYKVHARRTRVRRGEADGRRDLPADELIPTNGLGISV